MNKKTYLMPQTRIIDFKVEGMIATSMSLHNGDLEDEFSDEWDDDWDEDEEDW